MTVIILLEKIRNAPPERLLVVNNYTIIHAIVHY
jgi:hypothetical protein